MATTAAKVPALALVPGDFGATGDPADAQALSRAVAVAVRSADARCAAFQQLAAAYAASAEGQERQELGARLAAAEPARRAALGELIAADPERAIARRLAYAVRIRLPAALQERLERRVDATGDLMTLARLDEAGAQPAVERVALVDGQRLKASLSGRRLAAPPAQRGIALSGIALDGRFAVREQPARPLEPQEPIPAAARIVNPDRDCPVSGRSDPQAVAVVRGSEAVWLCHGGHLAALNDSTIAAEAAAHRAARTAQSSWTEGIKKILYVRARFSDQASDPCTVATADATLAGVKTYWEEASYGKTSCTWTTPAVTLPGTIASYGSDDFKVLEDAMTLAEAAGFDPDDYDLYAVRYNGGPGSFAGQAYVGWPGAWLKNDTMRVSAHEYGHNFGLWHANSWTSSTIIGDGTHVEYGNVFEVMGSSTGHYNPGSKNVLGWLPSAHVATVPAGSGGADVVQTITVWPYDHPALLATTQPQAVKVPRDATYDCWIHLNSLASGTNPWFRNGLVVKWNSPFNDDGPDRLLDMTPGSPNDRSDALLAFGRTFFDARASLWITPLKLNPASSPVSATVLVARGTFAGNQAPTLVVGASLLTPATGATVAFTATSSDADGHALSYYWDFNDNTAGTKDENAATASHAWTTAGRYRVTCTASDGRGGATTRQVLITVAGAADRSVSGRVANAGGAGIGGVRVALSSTRSAWTDSDGFYSLESVSDGSYTMAAYLEGFTIVPVFTNPQAVAGAAVAGRDFTLTTSQVTVSVSDASATENSSDQATVQISRSGPSTTAITIGATLTGTAGDGDFTMTAGGSAMVWAYDYAIPGFRSTVTIPASSSGVALVITAIPDSVTEPTEQAVITLTSGSTFQVVAPGTATVQILNGEPPTGGGTPPPASSDGGGGGGGGSSGCGLGAAVTLIGFGLGAARLRRRRA